MNLSARLKMWLIQNKAVKADSDDSTFRKAAGEALASGDLSTKKFEELTSEKSEEDDAATKFFQDLGETLGELKSLIADEKDEKAKKPAFMEEEEEGEEDEGKDSKKDTVSAKPGRQMIVTGDAATDQESDNAEALSAAQSGKPKKPRVIGGKSTEGTITKGGQAPSRLEKMVTSIGGVAVDDDESPFDVRVKAAAEQYSATKSAMIYPEHDKKGHPHRFAGRPVMDFNEPGVGRAIDNPSDRDKAVAGAYAKFLISASVKKSKNLAFMTMPQHDKELLCYALENEKWSGSTNGDHYEDIKQRKLTPREQKALIDDSTSGGLEAAPIIFDDQVIQTPLLYGELFPLVNTVPIDRGRRVEGVVTGVVTGGWGGVDDTSIALFDTTSYVSAFDTTIFRWEGSIRIGLDFLSDTPIDFGAHVTNQYGERLLEDLDDVIAAGDGTTQPEGIINKSGTTSVNFGAATNIGNYESLRFSVKKAEHRSNLLSTAVFCGTETSYQRARAIPVGTSDARRLGGAFGTTLGGVSDYANYSWMGVPFKINESLTNAQIFYAILGRYRMYRRRGLTIRTSTEGDTLIRRNEMLIVATARYGGQLERAATAAKTTTATA